MSGSGSCHTSYHSNIPAISVAHFSLGGCQIIFFINRIFDVHFFIFHSCRLHYFILVKKLNGQDGLYAGDWCPPRIPFSFAAHGTLYLTKCFSRDQLESLQCILDDAVENIINLSPCRIGIHLPAEDEIDCVVPGEVSVSKAYKMCYVSI